MVFSTNNGLAFARESAASMYAPPVYLEGAMVDGVKAVRIDLSKARLVDHTAQERLEGAANEWKDVTLELVGLDRLQPVSDHPRALRRSAA